MSGSLLLDDDAGLTTLMSERRIDKEEKLSRGRLFGIVTLNLIASIHVVWYYLTCVRSYLHLDRFEDGLENTPFQHRLLMIFPLRWAHHSPWLIHLAEKLTGWSAWFPNGVRPEGLIQAPIDLVCVVITGLVARSIYRAASSTQMLSAYIYPLSLLMVVATYSLYTMHKLRFVYDLPSLGFFSVALYLLYFRKSMVLFAALFIVATVNRETTLFLLVLYVLRQCVAESPSGKMPERYGPDWRMLLAPSTWVVVLPLLGYWILWHLWIARLFVHNVSEASPRLWLNVGILLWPTSWAQILSAFAFCWPIVLFGRKHIEDRTLRIWQWIMPIWFFFMLHYGILIETRIFGELIPYMAVMTALIVEQQILRTLRLERCTESPSEVPLAIDLLDDRGQVTDRRCETAVPSRFQSRSRLFAERQSPRTRPDV